ncbi:MAG: hypothetical protein KDK97_12530 [Verrucomicrobiales bacterium]|nr:hypothetical protein [Verrucomicrobiales bacterium]MCP5560130.1 hypothetical protein [Verrucomicrobiaceae bacterium]
MKKYITGRAKGSTAVTGWLAAIAMSLIILGMHAQAGEDLNAVFQQGRQAYFRGDLATAEQLLVRVQAANPNHFQTNAMLAQIKVAKKDNTPTLRKTYEGVIVPRIEFTDVTLPEAATALRTLSSNASAGKVVPNFIVKDSDKQTKSITLNLKDVPLTEAINYLAQMSGTKATYEAHAVVFGSVAE